MNQLQEVPLQIITAFGIRSGLDQYAARMLAENVMAPFWSMTVTPENTQRIVDAVLAAFPEQNGGTA